jgi:hypothetical protein
MEEVISAQGSMVWFLRLCLGLRVTDSGVAHLSADIAYNTTILKAPRQVVSIISSSYYIALEHRISISQAPADLPILRYLRSVTALTMDVEEFRKAGTSMYITQACVV